MSLLGLKGLKIKLTTKHLCVSSDCTRTPVLISLGKIMTNNLQYNTSVQYLFAIYDIYKWKKKMKKIDDRK